MKSSQTLHNIWYMGTYVHIYTYFNFYMNEYNIFFAKVSSTFTLYDTWNFFRADHRTAYFVSLNKQLLLDSALL